jgi:hypothetical protein
MSVTILNYKPITGKGTLQGFCDIYVPKMGLEFFSVSYYKKGTQEWINLPQKEITDRDTGTKKWLCQVRFKERTHQEAFGKAVIDAIKAFQGNSGTSAQQNIEDVDDEWS